jgi:hypothetical protein
VNRFKKWRVGEDGTHDPAAEIDVVELRQIDSYLMPDDPGCKENPDGQQEDNCLPNELGAEDDARLRGLKLGSWGRR